MANKLANLRKCNFNDICRTCLCKATRLHKLKNPLQKTLNIRQMLCLLLPQLFEEASDDMMPAHICSKCLSKLQLCHEFQQSCLSAHQLLREVLTERYNERMQRKAVTCTEQPKGVANAAGSTVDKHSNLMMFAEPVQHTTIVADMPAKENNAKIAALTSPQLCENDATLVDTTIVEINLPTIANLDEVAVKEQHAVDPFAAQQTALPVDLEIKPTIEETTISCEDHADVDYVDDDADDDKVDDNDAFSAEEQQVTKATPAPVQQTGDGFLCPICKTKLPTRYYLQKHMRLQHEHEIINKTVPRMQHYEERPFLCTLCGKTFTANSNLLQHMMRHSNARPFQCRYCIKKFHCSSGLSKHMHVHRKIPHVCDTCGAKFSRSDSLREHKETHTGEPRYKCEECNKNFFYRKHWRVHMSRHANERPHKCSFCPRSFNQKGDLNRHLRFHVGEKTYSCSYCDEKFRYVAEMRTHEFEAHVKNLIAIEKEEGTLSD